jgi:hypothetical protein
MYKFGKKSQQRLDTCIPEIQEIMHEAIKIIDFSIDCGTRSKEEQDDAFRRGASKVQFPNSKHNANPSPAIDVIPYPVDWNDIPRFAQLGGIIKGIALMKGYKIRCGFDWDMDGDITDHKFMDWPHIEYLGKL